MSGPGIWALIPVKNFALAKQRLGTCLAAPQREQLSRAMLDDVLHAAGMTAGIEGVMVVSDEPELHDMRRCHGFEWLREPESRGLNAALSHAVATLAARGAGQCCILHADLPLARPETIENLLDRHRAVAEASPRAVTLVPDRSNYGTNAMVCSPPDVMQFAYGGASFAAHRELLGAGAIACNEFHADSLALDIDTVPDLRCLRRHYRMSENLATSTTEAVIAALAETTDCLPCAELPRRTA